MHTLLFLFSLLTQTLRVAGINTFKIMKLYYKLIMMQGTELVCVFIHVYTIPLIRERTCDTHARVHTQVFIAKLFQHRRLYPDISFFQLPTDYPCRDFKGIH